MRYTEGNSDIMLKPWKIWRLHRRNVGYRQVSAFVFIRIDATADNPVV